MMLVPVHSIYCANSIYVGTELVKWERMQKDKMATTEKTHLDFKFN